MRMLRKDPPEGDMPLIETMASDATRVSMEDPVNAILRNQLAADRQGMMENKVQVGDDFVEMPYPTSYTGRADVDSTPYILDLAGVPALMKGAGKLLFKTGAKRGGDAVVDAARREMLGEFSERQAGKRAIAEVQEKQAKDRLQNVADRALRDASKEDSQAILDLQGKLESAVRSGRIEEQVAEQLFEENIDNIFNQARLDDIVMGDTEKIAKNLGPTMRELFEFDPDLFDDIYYGELISPVSSKKISGKVNPLMNQFGGRVRVIKR